MFIDVLFLWWSFLIVEYWFWFGGISGFVEIVERLMWFFNSVFFFDCKVFNIGRDLGFNLNLRLRLLDFKFFLFLLLYVDIVKYF